MLFALLPLFSDPAYAAPKYKSPDEKRNWHDAAWGTSPREDMKCEVQAIVDMKVCTRPTAAGDRALGDLNADSVVYHFFQERLYRVEIQFNTDDAAMEVANALQMTYGDSTWDPREAKQVWKGNQVQIGLARNARKPGSVLTYQYGPLLLDVDLARAKAGGDRLKNIAGTL